MGYLSTLMGDCFSRPKPILALFNLAFKINPVPLTKTHKQLSGFEGAQSLAKSPKPVIGKTEISEKSPDVDVEYYFLRAESWLT